MTMSLVNVVGIGPKTEIYLVEHGITSVEKLIAEGSEILSSAPGFNPSRAEAAIKSAESLIAKETPQETLATSEEKKNKKSSRKSKKKDKSKGKKKDKKGKKNKKKKKK